MSGIVFLKTNARKKVKDFYINEVGMELWLEWADCIVLKHGNMLLGFCDRAELDTQGCYTFLYDTKEEVDALHEKFKDIATSEPKENSKYEIYNFFTKDPEGRTVEFQAFLRPTNPI